MFVARSFSHTSKRQRKEKNDEKAMIRATGSSPRSEHRGFGWRPESFFKQQQEPQPCQKSQQSAASTRRSSAETIKANSQPAATSATASLPPPSEPMVVPSRPSSSQRNTPGMSDARPPPPPFRASVTTVARDSKNVSPSVAAMLANTSIPKPRSFRKQRPKESERRISIDDVVGSWKQTEFVGGTPPGISPAMDVLMSPPEESNDQMERASETGSGMPARSSSSDSMPSLEIDSDSGISWSLPSTPEFNMRGGARRETSTSVPKSVDSSSEHPLMRLEKIEEPEHEVEDSSTTERRPSERPTKSISRASSISYSSSSPSIHSSMRSTSPRRSPVRASSFKSNLTASFSNLRNNLSRTFSNFAAPSGPALADDHLTRSLLGTPYHPEMRPRPIAGTPTPQMRRYMNPHALHLYDFHLHNSHVDDADLEYVAAANAVAAEARANGDPNAPAASDIDVIPMDTYVRRSKSPRAGAATEAGRAMEKSQQQRREPRENPDFLRIAVLEMQMRKAGKTEGPSDGSPLAGGGAAVGPTGSGRRGWFLPPRTDNVASDERAGSVESARRWVGVSA